MKPEKEKLADRQSITNYVRYLAKQKAKEENLSSSYLSNNLKLLADLIETEADKIERD